MHWYNAHILLFLPERHYLTAYVSCCTVFILDDVLCFAGLPDEAKEIHVPVGILLLPAGRWLPEALRQEGSRWHKKKQGAHNVHEFRNVRKPSIGVWCFCLIDVVEYGVMSSQVVRLTVYSLRDADLGCWLRDAGPLLLHSVRLFLCRAY